MRMMVQVVNMVAYDLHKITILFYEWEYTSIHINGDVLLMWKRNPNITDEQWQWLFPPCKILIKLFQCKRSRAVHWKNMRESACTNTRSAFNPTYDLGVWMSESFLSKGYALWLETNRPEPTLNTQWVTSLFPTIFVTQKGKKIRCLYLCVLVFVYPQA